MHGLECVNFIAWVQTFLRNSKSDLASNPIWVQAFWWVVQDIQGATPNIEQELGGLSAAGGPVPPATPGREMDMGFQQQQPPRSRLSQTSGADYPAQPAQPYGAVVSIASKRLLQFPDLAIVNHAVAAVTKVELAGVQKGPGKCGSKWMVKHSRQC